MGCSSSSPSGIIARLRAGVAQLVEQLICNQPVGGSNPFASPTIGTALLTTPDDALERQTAMRSASREWSVGVVAKRSNAAGCKPAGLAPSKVRILPAPPISGERITGGSSSVGRASAFQAEGRGSESRLPLQFENGEETSGTYSPRGSVVEHFLGKEGVTGSIPVVGSIFEDQIMLDKAR